jgi:hypothetical protein
LSAARFLPRWEVADAFAAGARFDFAMEVERRPTGLCLTAVRP